MRAALLVLAAAACSGGAGPEPLCETKLPIVDHDAWRIVAPENDPFPTPPDAGADAGPLDRGRCQPSDMTVELLNQEESFTIVTRECSYGTVEQPALVDVVAGEPLTMRLWYFSQMRFDAALAEILVAFGDRPVWTESVAIPATEGGLLFATLASPMAIAAGAPVRWHLSNHGVNSWNLLEISVTRKVPCSQLAKGDAGADM